MNSCLLSLEHDLQCELCKVAFKEEGSAISEPLRL